MCIYICVCDFVYIYHSEAWFIVLICVYIFTSAHYMIANRIEFVKCKRMLTPNFVRAKIRENRENCILPYRWFSR